METKSQNRSSVARRAKTLDAKHVVAAMSGQIEPIRTGPAYQLGLALAAVVMLVLPLVYLSLIALVGLGVIWHVIHDAEVLNSANGRAALLLYFGPMLVGAIVLAFLIKPLLARAVDDSVPLTLRRDDEPVLFEFVDRLCKAVGAPVPSRIDVDLEVNASASFRRGWIGLFNRDLVLTFGLPLVTGLNARQFAGVLAHELGHFAQGSGMRLSYIVRRVNSWFARIVYQRDRWDVALSRAARQHHAVMMLVCGTAVAVVWVTRRTLWCLMWVGHGACSFLLRQMEFDADRHQVRVTGSDNFDPTFQSIRCLSAATNAAFSDLNAAWRERRLCDDLPALIRARQADMPGEIRTALLQAGKDDKTKWFNSHPCDTDRLASAKREAAAGLFNVEAPATILFSNFSELSRIATMLFYKKKMGAAFQPAQLSKTESLVATRVEVEQSHDALKAFFLGLIDPLRPVFPDRLTGRPPGPDAAAELLLDLRSKLLELEPAARQAAEKFKAAADRAATLSAIRELRTAGIAKSGVKEAALDALSNEALAAEESKSRNDAAIAQATISRAESIGIERMNLALSIAAVAQSTASEAIEVGQDGDDYELADEPKAGSGDLIFNTLVIMRPAASDVEGLRGHLIALSILMSRVKSSSNSKPLVDAILWHSRKASGLLRDIHQQLGNVPYPYTDDGKRLTLARYVVPTMPPYNQIAKLGAASDGTIDAYGSLYMRLMSDLANRAQIVETELGLPPLDTDQKKKD